MSHDRKGGPVSVMTGWWCGKISSTRPVLSNSEVGSVGGLSEEVVKIVGGAADDESKSREDSSIAMFGIEDMEHKYTNDYIDGNEIIENMKYQTEENVEESKVDDIPSSRPVLISSKVKSSSCTTEDLEEEGDKSSEDSFKSCIGGTDSECEQSALVISAGYVCDRDHVYEIGVVVVKVSHRYLHLVGPRGVQWLEARVDPLISLVYIDGIRTKEVFSVKNGSMGHMVLRKCLNCQLNPNLVIDSPALVWFGVSQVPCVRGQEGVVVGVDGQRRVVQLESPPAARIARLVLLHGDDLDCPPLQSKVKVWAWTRNIKSGLTDRFLEGAAIITIITEDHDKIIIREDKAPESDSSSQGKKAESNITSTMSIKLQLQRLLLQRLQFLSFIPSA